MKDIAREFLKKLDEESERLSRMVSEDELGVGFLTAIKEFDFYRYNYIRHRSTEETDLHFHLLQLGMPRLITAILSRVPQFPYPTLTFKSPPELIIGALEAVGAFGFVEHGKQFGHGVMAGECGIRKAGEQHYEILIPNSMSSAERVEASVESHYYRIGKKHYDTAIEEQFGKTGVKERLQTILQDKVWVFRDSFIGYGAHPDLDDFFFGQSSVELQQQPGYDSFNWRLQFGGVSMQKYILAITFFLSLALKHEAFAAALVKKEPKIRLRDILTITCDKAEFRESLFAALDQYGPSYEGYVPLTDDEADTILRVLSVTRTSVELLKPTMASIPFLVEFSETAWIRCNAGIQQGGIDFLLNSLRYHFPKDYDRHQQNREQSMQRALRRILGEYIPKLSFVDNVRLRTNGRTVTDIDFAVVDEFGFTLLFQLKHQDSYGGDIRQRSSRGGRLRAQCENWLTAVRTWIADNTETQLNRALRMNAGKALQKPRLVILTRHFAHFLSEVELEQDAVYATWIQLFDALMRMHAEGRDVSLESLFAVLSEYMSHLKAQDFDLDGLDTYHLENLSFSVLPNNNTE